MNTKTIKSNSITALLLAVAMIFSVTLAACSNKDEDGKDPAESGASEDGGTDNSGGTGGDVQTDENGEVVNNGNSDGNSGGDPTATSRPYVPVEIPDDYIVVQEGESEVAFAIPQEWESVEAYDTMEATWIDRGYSTENATATVNLSAMNSGGVTQSDFQDEAFLAGRKAALDESFANMYGDTEPGVLDTKFIGNNDFLVYTFAYTGTDGETGAESSYSAIVYMTSIDGNMVALIFAYPKGSVDGNEAEVAAMQEQIVATMMMS